MQPARALPFARAVWNGAVIAQSERYELVEGNVYFPPETVNPAYLRDSDSETHCGWKGQAQYKTLVVNGRENVDAAWYYADPLPAARNIAGHIAFWHGVVVTR